MPPLRQRMINDMTVRGLAENIKQPYLASVTGLARHDRRSPDQISAQKVQDYLIHLHEQRGLSWLSWKSCNCVRFLHRITLGVPDPHFYLPSAKTPSTLPEILNHDELVRPFTVTTNPTLAGSPGEFRSATRLRCFNGCWHVCEDATPDHRAGAQQPNLESRNCFRGRD